MADQRVFTLSQIAQHKSKNDCWFVINGRVLNVTKFLEEHPGGDEVLLESAGRDATKDFDDIGHSKAAKELLLKYQVGVLQGYTIQDAEKDANTTTTLKQTTRTKELSAFVIKNDSAITKYSAFLEFFVPILVAGLYFGYRCFTHSSQISY